MSLITRAQIEAQLVLYQDPYLKQDLLSAKVVQDIIIEANKTIVKLVFGFPTTQYQAALIAALDSVMAPITDFLPVEYDISWKVDAHGGQRGVKSLPSVKNIIAVASGKGGVGKSTTTVNLALALAQEGARVGILDADIYGPSQPMMLGASLSPELKDKKTLLPILCHGLQSMSIGYLIDITTPMVWRGPMVSTALQQLLLDTLWDDLDYLFIDLPPGTGDIQLTMAQKIPVSGSVIVTTPQDLALLDARRAIEMFRKVSVPVLGVVENMSSHTCTNCGHEEPIFGVGGGASMAQQYQVDLLGALPLDIQIREQTDQGKPTVVAHPQSQIARSYHDIARHVAAKLSLQAKDYSRKFPSIVIKND